MRGKSIPLFHLKGLHDQNILTLANFFKVNGKGKLNKTKE